MHDKITSFRRGSLRRARARLTHIGAALRRERGAATAEYAIVIMAAVGFAGLLVVIMRSEAVRTILTDLVQSALTSGG
ncbi:DUF4244 domain-containing protein [Salinibacterium sp. GXW1014]|uniref:DUF4244 domain-containing protein n=1 Tax=Salinibacterium sp. GXW1014 TaxID=3377838 RepID=UPI00383A0CF9